MRFEFEAYINFKILKKMRGMKITYKNEQLTQMAARVTYPYKFKDSWLHVAINYSREPRVFKNDDNREG